MIGHNRVSAPPRRSVGMRSCKLQLELLEDRTLLTGPNFLTEPVVPTLTPAMTGYLKSVLQMGLNLGNQANVFIKVGDSISASPSFLTALGDPSYNPNDSAVAGAHTGLAPTIDYFRTSIVDGAGDNSFTHVGLAAVSGWLSSDVLNPAHDPLQPGVDPTLTPLENEIHLTHPSVALIMVGTNDIGFNTAPATFKANLLRIGVLALQNGVIPVFSSIPDRPFGGTASEGQVPVDNQIISDVAFSLDVPFWNYWAALQSLPNQGISTDQVHPSVDPNGSGLLTDSALSFGFNVRNLTAVQVLDDLKQGVIGSAPSLSPATGKFVQDLYAALLGRTAGPAEINDWEQVLVSGGSRADIVQGIWQSPEHYTRLVAQDYQTILQRSPGSGETAYWVGRFEGGASEEEITSEFLSSPEYLNGRPFPEEQIAGLYQTVLNRTPSTGEIAIWLGQMQHGVSLHDVAMQIETSPEGYGDALAADYTTYLGRTAGSADYAAWLGGLESGQFGLAGLAQGILASDEYFARAAAGL